MRPIYVAPFKGFTAYQYGWDYLHQSLNNNGRDLHSLLLDAPVGLID